VKKLIPAASSRPNQTTRRDVVEDGHLKASQVIPSVEECIRGSQVDLRTATKFSRRSWRIYSRFVGDHHAKQVSPDVYKLSEPLLQTTRRQLAERGKEVRGYKAVDLLASLLCKAAYEIGPPPEEPDDSSDYWVSGTPIWGSDHPISEAWAGLGQQEVPWDMEGSLSFNSGTSKWDEGPARLGLETVTEVDASINTGGFFLHDAPPAPDYTDPLVVCIRRNFEQKKKFLPKLTIEVEGAPICLLMEAFNSQIRGKTVRIEAENLWTSIGTWLAGSSGFKKAKRGRPALNQGIEAAFLHDFRELSWSQVARKLCKQPPPHQHDQKCEENFRKQAEQYWKALEKKFRLVK
jgi:hypothetical protein